MEITDFKKAFQKGFHHANKFQVLIAGFDQAFEMVVTDSPVPEFTIGEIVLNFRGIKIYENGDPALPTWTITVRDDADHTYRKLFEGWQSLINSRTSDEQADTQNYKTTAFISALNNNNEPTLVWTLGGVWPTTLGEISYSSESGDTVSTYTVTFRIDQLESIATIPTGLIGI